MKYSILLVAALAVAASCGSKNGSNASAAENSDSAYAINQNSEQIVAEPTKVFADTTVNWGNATTRISITRSPNGNTVIDEDFPSTRYRDNDIRLKVERNGETAIDKTITKDNFKDLIASKIYSRYILECLVLDKVSSSEAVFSASVVNPTQDDEYLSFKVVLSPSGSLSISKSTDSPMH